MSDGGFDPPVEGVVELPLPVERMWRIFCHVPAWAHWNSAIYWARVPGGALRAGGALLICFNPIRPGLPYKLPAPVRVVECEPLRAVTWEVTALPGFYARHRYTFEDRGPGRCRFGSHEVARGPLYGALRRFWRAHFQFVCAASLEGALRWGARA